MDRALVVVLVKAVALEAVLGLVLARAEATGEASSCLELIFPWEDGMEVPML